MNHEFKTLDFLEDMRNQNIIFEEKCVFILRNLKVEIKDYSISTTENNYYLLLLNFHNGSELKMFMRIFPKKEETEDNNLFLKIIYMTKENIFVFQKVEDLLKYFEFEKNK